jgi:di/tricarboxylate transporter
VPVSPDVASLLALGLVVGAGCFPRLNVGALSLVLAFALGLLFCGLSVVEVAAGFPVQLFLRLTGITLLFALASVNGTLSQMAWRAVGLVRADPRLVLILIFGLAAALASSGAGNFAAVALLAPAVMAVAGRLGVSGFLMAVMLVNGASAGAFSPTAPTGIVAGELMGRIGLGGHEWAVYLYPLAAHTLVALIGFAVLGGAGLRRSTAASAGRVAQEAPVTATTFGRRGAFTMAALAAVTAAAAGFRFDIGVVAFAGAGFLVLVRAADERAALRAVPWGMILMVCGVTTLVSVIETAGGIVLFARLLSRLAGPAYLPGLVALAAGVVSVYASSIGVVMPALLPAVPSLLDAFGGGNPLMVAFSVNVAAHLVDISPLSPLGAMCLAYAAPGEDRAALFRKLMGGAWATALAGSLLCQLLFGYR